MSAASRYVEDLDSKSKEQLKSMLREVTESLVQAAKAEEDAVELVFELRQGLEQIETAAVQAANLATGYNLKSEIKAIATKAQKLRSM